MLHLLLKILFDDESTVQYPTALRFLMHARCHRTTERAEEEFAEKQSSTDPYMQTQRRSIRWGSLLDAVTC